MIYLKMRGTILIIVVVLGICLANTLNITEIVDSSFQSPSTTYFRVKQGDTHTLDIYGITGWEEAIQIQGNWPSFCRSSNSYQTLFNLNSTQQLQDHDPSKPIYKVVVNPMNGIIYAFVYNEGLHALTYSASDNRFTNMRLFNSIDHQIQASHIYISGTSNKNWLIIVTRNQLIRYDITNSEEAIHGGSIGLPNDIPSNFNVTILTYAPMDLVIFNHGTKLYFYQFSNSTGQFIDFVHDIGDFAIDLNSMVLYVVVYGGLYEERFDSILTHFADNTLDQYPAKYKLVSTFAFYIKEIEARNFTLIVTQDPRQTSALFYTEYYRKNRDSDLVPIRSPDFVLIPQEAIPDFLMIGKNYAIYWVDETLHVFPIAIKDNLYRDSQFPSDSFQALTYYESRQYQGRILHVIGEKNSKITVLQIEFTTPTLSCSPAGSSGQRNLMEGDATGKYYFDIRVLGRRCSNLPETEDPEYVCSRSYSFEMDVLDETHAGLSRLVVAIIIMISFVIVIGVVAIVIVAIKYKKKKRLANAFSRLPLPNEPQEDNRENQIEMSDVHLRGFEQAAVREGQNEQS